MKKLFKTSLILLSLLSVMFTSCRKEYEVPPISDVPVGKVLTIDDILAMPAKATFDTISSVFGIVTADEQSGNLYKVIFIQDRATGKAIELRLNTSSAARIGDSVRVCLDSTIMYNPYHNLPQLTDNKGNGFSPDGHLLIYPYNNPIEPKVVTIADIKSGGYIAALVKLDSVEFVEKNTTFCDPGETTNRHLMDATNPSSDENFVVRTSNYASFAYDYMPISKGSLVAIASIYNSTYQLTIRSKSEMIFSEWGEPVAPTPGAGDGTQNHPYNVATAITLQGEKPTCWVEGYIVGAAKNGLSSVSSNDDINWSTPVDSYTNVVIADEASCHEISQCVIVNLPAGTALRSQVNIFDNPENLGKKLNVYGTLRTYFGQAGLRDCPGTESDFVLEGGGGGGGGGGEVIFSETFASSQGEFVIADVNLSGVNYVWAHDSQYSCMKASAFAGGQHAAESWLVSPAINLSGKGSATLSFQHAVNKGVPTVLSVMVSENYSSDVTAATWAELNVSVWPEGNSWTFKDATADLTSYVGKTVTIAFKYTSEASDNNCPTWEVKNVSVKLE